MSELVDAVLFLAFLAAICVAAVWAGTIVGKFIAVRRVERAGIILTGTYGEKYAQAVALSEVEGSEE